MLIELSVENFRSIHERQTLSMVAAPRLKKRQNLIFPKVVGEKFPALLKVVALYGPNASGKTTLVHALRALVTMARQTPSVLDARLPVVPFKFVPELRDKPSVFEVHFIRNETRYTFDLSVTSERIHRERLTEYVGGEPIVLYDRRLGDLGEEYTFDSRLEGGGELHQAWRRLTNPKTLFIAQAVANSAEDLNQLRKPFSWFDSVMAVDKMGEKREATRRLCARVPQFGGFISALLTEVDVPVVSVKSTFGDHGEQGFDEVKLENIEKMEAHELFFLDKEIKTTLRHRGTLGEADFDFEEESEGTKNLFAFALPWFVFQNDPDKRASLLVIDEMDSSLHPKLVEELVRRHLEKMTDCQLFFTTHDTHLMDSKLLRRDQIWFTERDETGATQLRSAHDFEGREGEDIEKRYFEGRYRSLPVIGH